MRYPDPDRGPGRPFQSLQAICRLIPPTRRGDGSMPTRKRAALDAAWYIGM